ncbi:MAG: NAD-dependent epimerase/dehydratase family protein [Eubacteriales bacterium]|nr:NAD-dependent epimerase/dehydratase family protein [Eubacteriales bacterium]
MKRDIIEEDLKDIYNRNIPWEMLENKTVLVTGAYGMLASYVVYMLIYLNEVAGVHVNIIALVRSADKFAGRFKEYANAKYMKVYTASLDGEIDISENVDYIIHAASLASPQYYSVCPVEVLKPNIIGNYHMLELAVKKKVLGYLLFSTGDIYGVVKGETRIAENTLGVLDPLDIHNCYSESKRMAETMCKAWLVQKNVPCKIVRIWHTYAPTMDLKTDPRVFASFANDIIEKRDIVIKSDGKAKRSFCYIADAVAAYFLVLLCGKNGEAYNVCNTSQFCSIAQLAEKLTGLYPELGLKVIYQKRAADDPYVENSVANYIAPDNQKLCRLGWSAVYTIEEGFRRVISARQ